ncbi:fimbria/pilus outer membrane usher protein [Serratia sp. NPDC078593]|uniref:fimbria/pilus outer membrane usher protein n=1 Tax=unclassified Serratia (in: enterobacteria) TaxID=2647522 RepID=UPI0037CF256F
MHKISLVILILIVYSTGVNAGEHFYISQGERDIGYIELEVTKGGFPCFDREKLLAWNILSEGNKDQIKSTGCITSKDLYPLNISVGLIDKINIIMFTFLESTEIKSDPRLSIENRDYGIPAILINYGVNYKKYEGSRYRRRKQKDNVVAELESGINFRQWRLRSKQYHDNEEMRQKRVKFSEIYVERDISDINSRLHIGDGYNDTFYLDAFPYRGIRLASDDNMFTSSQRAVLPWVYGVAITDAEVEIMQNGKPVYRTLVSPGDFVLRNIKLFDKSGVITMTVKESDGSINYYDVPWNRLDNIIEKDAWKYDISFGKFISDGRDEESTPIFFQSGVGYGISAKNSVFGGALLSPGYYSHSFGIGQRLNQYGDVTLNHQVSHISAAGRGAVKGEKLRLQYVSDLSKINTSIRLYGEYFLRPHFNNFNDYSYNAVSGYFCCDYYKKEYTVDFSINALISPSQNLSINVNQEKYQQNQGKRTFYSMRLMQNVPGLSLDLDMSYYQYQSQKNEMRFAINFRIPLKKIGFNNTSMNLGYNYDPYNLYQSQIGISGKRLNNNLNYQVVTRYGKHNKASYQAYTRYRYAAGESTLRYQSGTDYALYSAGSTGSLVIHQGGVTFGQTLGETNALVYAPKHPNTELPDQVDVITNERGYAVIPDLIPYQVNVVNDAIGKEPAFDEEALNEVINVPTLGALSYYELVN